MTSQHTNRLVADFRHLTEDLRLWELAVIVAGILGVIAGLVVLP